LFVEDVGFKLIVFDSARVVDIDDLEERVDVLSLDRNLEFCDQSGHLTIDEVTNLIAKLKISVERKYVYPFFKVVDVNNSGGIEYDEFEAYILNEQQ
jgi:Ca2+-binding EF-hand superfamily protein